MTMSLPRRRRASAMARTLPAISADGITCLPSMCPQRLGNTWSSMLTPAARIYIRHHRDAHRADNVAGDIQHVLHVHQPHVGLRQQAPGDAETTDLHGFEPGALDNPRAQRVV